MATESEKTADSEIVDLLCEYKLYKEDLNNELKTIKVMKIEELEPNTADIYANELNKIFDGLCLAVRNLRKFNLRRGSAVTGHHKNSIGEAEGFLAGNKSIVTEFLSRFSKVRNANVQNSHQDARSGIDPNIKHLLPKLNLSIFKGNDVTDSPTYNSWKRTFNELIGNKTDISDTMKIAYLIGSLEGYAKEVIETFTKTNSNYDAAMELLDKEFLDKTVINLALYDKILNSQPDTTNGNAFHKVKLYLAEIKSSLNSLTNNGKNWKAEPVCQEIMAHIVHNNLPLTLRQHIYLETKIDNPSLDMIFELTPRIINTLNYQNPLTGDLSKSIFVSKNADADIKVNATSVTKSSKPKGVNKKQKPSKFPTRISNKNVNTKSALHQGKLQEAQVETPTGRVSEEKPKVCKFCSSDEHVSTKCANYKTTKERIKQLQDLGLCAKCMGKTHTVEKCLYVRERFKYKCFICDEDDHISPLCPKIDSKQI